MNADRFNELVEAQAHKSVQDKIYNFRRTVKDALCKLDPSLNQNWSDFWNCKAVKELFSSLQQGYPSTEFWPERLLENEKNETSKALFETLDLLQQAIVSADSFVPSVKFKDVEK